MDPPKIARPWTPAPAPAAAPAGVPPGLPQASEGPDARRPEDHKAGFGWGDGFGIVAGLLLVAFFGLQLQSAYVTLFGNGTATFSVRAIDLWFNSAILFVVLGVLPWLWVLTTRHGGWSGMVAYFGLHAPGRTLLQGVGLGLVMVVILLAVGLIMQVLGADQQNAAIGPIQAILTLPLVLAISLSAAIGEEVLFRGIIQKYIGLWPQAILFGSLHAYQGIYGIIITSLVGLLFGYVMQRRNSLWILIAAHFTFNLIQLAVLLIAPEAVA